MVLTILLVALIVIFVAEMRHSWHRLHVSDELIRMYRHDLDNPSLLDEIFDYCQNDFKLKRIMKKHAATRSDLDIIYKKLLLWANFKKGRNFIPISAFFYAGSLDYVLGHKNDDAKKIAMHCMNIFKI